MVKELDHRFDGCALFEQEHHVVRFVMGRMEGHTVNWRADIRPRGSNGSVWMTLGRNNVESGSRTAEGAITSFGSWIRAHGITLAPEQMAACATAIWPQDA